MTNFVLKIHYEFLNTSVRLLKVIFTHLQTARIVLLLLTKNQNKHIDCLVFTKNVTKLGLDSVATRVHENTH